MPTDLPEDAVELLADHPELLTGLARATDSTDAADDPTDAADDPTDAADGPDTAEVPSLAGLGPDAVAGLEALGELHRSGALEDLLELADVVSLLMAALDDEMVTGVARTGASLGEVADTAADEHVRQGLIATLAAVGDAEAADPERVGVIGALRATRDPEVRAGLGYLLALARSLGEHAAEDPE